MATSTAAATAVATTAAAGGAAGGKLGRYTTVLVAGAGCAAAAAISFLLVRRSRRAGADADAACGDSCACNGARTREAPQVRREFRGNTAASLAAAEAELLGGSYDLDSEATPTAAAEPPSAGPEDDHLAADPFGGAGSRDELDDGLRALGMLSGPLDSHRAAAAAAAATSRARQRPEPSAAARYHAQQDGVDGAEEVFVMDRVSPEEEERRYFANLCGGDDLFGGLDAPPAEAAAGGAKRAPAARPVIAYEG
eukprot:TRINITY_DN62903_c0_g1_i1.p1 TRINITY_DN62903_c0_g1~~TRINITY_DN62903_c0_g1_i1.p1  ORF type:complete len:274 (+),score=66.30 TRINITY_DN62903_c0_g1_i1:66-824(+)